MDLAAGPRCMGSEAYAACYADLYAPGPSYRTYRLRVLASCVAYVPEAQGSCCATVRTSYAYQPRVCRTSGTVWHHRPPSSVAAALLRQRVRRVTFVGDSDMRRLYYSLVWQVRDLPPLCARAGCLWGHRLT